jgi:FdhD protein
VAKLLISQNARPSTVEVDAINELGNVVPTAIAGEHPLTLFLDKRELLTLMTLGAAPEHLAIGYLRNQSIIENISQLASVQVDWDVQAVAITSRTLQEQGVTLWDDPARREQLQQMLAHKTVTTGCGQGTVFGDMMANVANLRLQTKPLSKAVLYNVMDTVRKHESIYKVAGAVHGCALANAQGEVLRFVEDVGRHNAVDAIAGWMWLENVTGDDKIFYTTGRLTSEMVIKCAQMGISTLLSRSGLTQMGHALAKQLDMLMIGRCQGKHFLIFSGAHHYVA